MYPVRLYTADKISGMDKVELCGPVDYVKEMPHVFKNTKINLNMTLRSIWTGIPLRAMDVMGYPHMYDLPLLYYSRFPQYFFFHPHGINSNQFFSSNHYYRNNIHNLPLVQRNPGPEINRGTTGRDIEVDCRKISGSFIYGR